MSRSLTLMLAAKRRVLVRIDNGTMRGRGSPVSALSPATRELCAELFAEGLIDLRTDPDGSQWFRTTELGRRVREGED